MKNKLVLAVIAAAIFLVGFQAGNIRWRQIRSGDRLGSGSKGQSADGNAASGYFTKNSAGGLTDGSLSGGRIDDSAGLGPLNLRGAPTSNGNILVIPGNVVGNARMQINAVRTDTDPFVIRQNAGNITANSFSIQNASGSTVFAVTGSSSGLANALTVTGHYVPQTDGIYDLGISGARIRKLWVEDIDFTGTCTGCSGGGGANPALSNLASTAVNVSVLPATDNSIDLGIGSPGAGAPRAWRFAYAHTMRTEELDIAVPGTNFGTIWRQVVIGGGTTWELRDNGGTSRIAVNQSVTPASISIRGSLQCLSGVCNIGQPAVPMGSVYTGSISIGGAGTGLFVDINRNVTSQNISPIDNNLWSLGTSVMRWKQAWFQSIDVVGVNNFFVGSGNWYNRTFAGLPGCTGVTDGWQGVDTTGKNLVICVGTVRYRAQLITP